MPFTMQKYVNKNNYVAISYDGLKGILIKTVVYLYGIAANS